MPLIFKIAFTAFFLYPLIDGLANTHEEVSFGILTLIAIYACLIIAIFFSSFNFMLLCVVLLFTFILGSFGYGIIQSVLEGNMLVIILFLIWILLFVFDNKQKKKG